MFSRYPLRFALPLVAFALAQQAELALIQRVRPGPGGLGLMFSGLLCMFSTFFLEVLAIDMFLTARNGADPHLSQARDVVAYPGLLKYFVRLVGLYIWWAFLLLVALVIAFIAFFVAFGHRTGAHPSGAQSLQHSVVIAGALLAFEMLLIRYQLVLPMIAFSRGDRPGLFAYGIARAQSIWGVLAALVVLEMMPITMQIAVAPLTRGYWASHVVLGYGLKAVWLVVLNAMYVWFILVKTALALQIVPEPVQASSPPFPKTS